MVSFSCIRDCYFRPRCVFAVTYPDHGPYKLRWADSRVLANSYNRVAGHHSCENEVLLTDILKEEWGFQGFVQSDFFAAHSTVASAEAGMDLEMPNDT